MILVTGGTGLVGRHLLLALTQNEIKLRALYRHQKSKDEVADFFAFAKAETRFDHIEWIQADITNLTQLQKAFHTITKVYHCAALISFDPYQLRNLRKTNTEGTANIVNLCLNQHVEKLCYVSTIATLSKTPNTPIDEDNHWDCNAANSVYAITKYGAEMEVWRGTQEGLNAIIFNPGIILGEGDYSKGSGVLFQRTYNGLSFYPSGSSAFIDVKDVVSIMIKGMQSSHTNKRFILTAYNLSYEKILKTIAHGFQKKPPHKKIPKWVLFFSANIDAFIGLFLKRRKITKASVQGLTQTNSFSNTAMRTTFEFTPTSIEETIHRITNHFNVIKE